MAVLLFLDESGHDRRESPYEVLAGVAIRDGALWPLICAIHDLEVQIFGRRYAANERELKANKLLRTKTYKQSAWAEPIPVDERTALAKSCLDQGAGATGREMAALAQAKLDFASKLLELCAEYDCKVVAAVVDRDAPRAQLDFLRKDYAYLFERFFYLLDDDDEQPFGLVVFDELERSQSNLLIDQMGRYFRHTNTGRERAGRIIPEPFFVHSDLTTGVQLADLVAYLISWSVRTSQMERDARPELAGLGKRVEALCFESEQKPPPSYKRRTVHSIAVIKDLRPREAWRGPVA